MGFKIETYGQLERHIEAQLKTGNIAPKIPTFFQRVLDGKHEIAQAGPDYMVRRSLAARYGAIFKQWEHMLIVNITRIALREDEVSRASVRHWQQKMFGKSMASSELSQYAVSSRGPNVKIPALPTDNEASAAAERFYLRMRHKLRIKADPEKFLRSHYNKPQPELNGGEPSA